MDSHSFPNSGTSAIRSFTTICYSQNSSESSIPQQAEQALTSFASKASIKGSLKEEKEESI